MSKIIKLLILSVFIFSILSASHIAVAGNSITDPPDDVGQIHWAPNEINGTYTTVTNHPNIDILSASYTKNYNGSITLELTVKGSIVDDNHTYYSIILNTPSLPTNYAEINAVFGLGYFGSLGSSGGQNIIPNTQFAFTNSSSTFKNDTLFSNGYGSVSSYVQGSHLYMTLGNNITASTHENTTLIPYPTNLPDYWEWHIVTWQGNDSQIHSGDWYLDYYPNSDNHLTKNLSPVTPGFEALSIIAIPLTIVTLKKLKVKKS